jgi:hypothetical protein
MPKLAWLLILIVAAPIALALATVLVIPLYLLGSAFLPLIRASETGRSDP